MADDTLPGENDQRTVPPTVGDSGVFVASLAVSKARRRRRNTVSRISVSEQTPENVTNVYKDDAIPTSESPRGSVFGASLARDTRDEQTKTEPATANPTTTNGRPVEDTPTTMADTVPPTTTADSTGIRYNTAHTV